MAVLKRLLLALTATLACSGVPLRPDGSPAEEPCPGGAREAMAAYGLAPRSSTEIDLDHAQRRHGPLVVYDGPIESATGFPMEDLPAGTRLLGRVWTGGPRVVIRYYSARLPDGKVIPFCGVAGWNGLGLPKAPGRPGSAALEQTFASVYVVPRFP